MDYVLINRSALKLLARSAQSLADTYAVLIERGHIDPTVDDIMAIRAAVELARRALG